MRAARTYRGLRAALEEAASVALATSAPQVSGNVTIVLTGDERMRRLNRDYRGKDESTDVLSFELGEGREPDDPFGDVVISVDTAQRQALAYDAPLGMELQRLVIHGMLHLCGYRHDGRREAASMHGLTRRLLKKLQRDTPAAHLDDRRFHV